jgi:WhiB family redox-sensing transcriptional regulator
LRCPVRPQCLDAALERGELFGIWGGLSREDRAALKRSRAGLAGVA